MGSPSVLRALRSRLSQWSHSPPMSSGRCFTTTSNRRDTYGFIGLGAMGYPMATNLRAKLQSEDALLVYDINEASTRKFVGEIGVAAAGTMGESKSKAIEVVGSAREAAERSETIITVLPEPQHVESAFGSILSSPLPSISSDTHKSRLFIDCSTIDPITSRKVASSVHESSSGAFVDAPMSGGVVGARAGTLTFMVGAPSSLVPRTSSVLSLMGRRIMRLGEQGAGLAGKLANNYLLAISNIATCEAMNLGLKLGLDSKVLAELINSSSGRCWSSEVNNPVAGISTGAPSERDYAGGFGVSLMKKDLRLAMTAAEEAGAKIELGDEAKRVYEEVEKTEKGRDFSVVYRWLSRDG